MLATQSNKRFVLTINGGSSSIKFAIYQATETLSQILHGQIENIGNSNAILSSTNIISNQKEHLIINATDYKTATNSLLDWLEKQIVFNSITAIGHRIVHGLQHTQPQIITPELLNELKAISSYDPEHLPEEITLIECFKKRYPSIVQIACFDTAFHTTMPPIAQLLPIPRRYFNMGIKRYGFHGLSYTYLVEELKNIAGNNVAKGKIILAHLGNGASLAAVKDGKSVDTSMGFTPTSGLPMGTRCGDLDPSVAWYLMEFEKLKPQQFNHLINHASGLLGISETSGDMRELLKIQATDSRAAEAIALFCYQIKKQIGSYAAVLGGLETLVFSGGIGEHTPEVRSQICDGLEFLGIELCEIKNMNNAPIISTEKSKVTVHVISTNEELMIAKLVYKVINDDTGDRNDFGCKIN